MQCPRCDRKLAEDDRFCPRCGLSRSLDGKPIDPLIGLTVSDRYRIEERIGVGGMGTVYRAQHIRFGQDVAIKVLHERYTGDKKLARRFEKEAMTYGQVSHPNLVGLHDFGRTPDGMFYMALEYCPGKPLSLLLRERTRFDWRLATDVVRQVAQGLGAAHDCGVVHRDLKPENIIMTEIRPNRYHVRLLDFGIAKREDEDGPRLTQAGMVFGTPEYMSPEQARGKTVDKRSDIYALGTLFYELIVGHPPFHGSDKLRIMQQQANEPPVPPRKYDLGDLPENLEHLIMRCLEKGPNSRVQDTQYFLDVIEDEGMSGHSINQRIIKDTTPVEEIAPVLVEETPGLIAHERHTLPEDERSSVHDTSAHSLLAEGLHHIRLTESTRAHLPILGAVLTIFIIVIGGGLLVRSSNSDAVNAVDTSSRIGEGESSHVSRLPSDSNGTSEKQTASKFVMTRANSEVVTNKPPAKVSNKKVDKPKSSRHKAALNAIEKSLETDRLETAKEHLTELKTKASSFTENERSKYEHLRTQLDQKIQARLNRIRGTLSKAKAHLESADFNLVERSLEKLRKMGAEPGQYREIAKKLRKAREALKRARKFYAKADCRRTLSTLQPILTVSPRSKRVAKLVDACRQALPPQRL